MGCTGGEITTAKAVQTVPASWILTATVAV